jgi:hypothetical protein
LIPEECLVAAIELRSGLALVPRKENSEMALPAWFGLVAVAEEVVELTKHGKDGQQVDQSTSLN